MAQESNVHESNISEARLKANQANAQLSTGPKTEEGKARSSMNARRHGLTGQFYVMNDQDRLAYNVFEKEMLEDLKPGARYERQLAICICQDHWRLNRSKGIEHNAFGLGHEELAHETEANSPEVQSAITQAQTFMAENRAIANLSLYEKRLAGMIARNKKDLDDLKQLRLAAEAKAKEEAELLLGHALMNEEKLDPAASLQVNGAEPSGLIPTSVLQRETIEVNGFVFSTGQLLAEMHRKQILEEARFYKAVGWNRNVAYIRGRLNFPKAA